MAEKQKKPHILEITSGGGEKIYIDNVRLIKRGLYVNINSTKYGTLGVLEDIVQDNVLGVAQAGGIEIVMKPFQRLRWVDEVPKKTKKADNLADKI